MRWGGVSNGFTDPNFVHASAEEKNQIEKYLMERKPLLNK